MEFISEFNYNTYVFLFYILYSIFYIYAEAWATGAEATGTDLM